MATATRRRKPQMAGGPNIIEADWSNGIRRDMPRNGIPDGGLYDATDYMLDRPGIAYKRGGTAYFGPACGSNTYLAGGTFADFPAGSQLLAVGGDGHLYNVVAGTSTDLGNMGFTSPDRPKLRIGGGKNLVVVTAGNGTSTPAKYDGTTLGTLGGTPPPGKYAEIFKTRLALAFATVGGTSYPNRVWFSQTPDIESTWNTSESWFDFDYPITGLAALQDRLLVFSKGHIELLLGDTPPPGTNMSRGILGAVGCSDARSIVARDGSVYFASPRGVYLTNGASYVCLTEQGGIESYWRSLFTGYTAATWFLSAGLYGHLLFVTVADNGGNLVDTLVCNVPRRAWWRLKNISPSMYASSLGQQEELYWFDLLGNRVQKMSGIFAPTSSNSTDADGDAVLPVLETRMLGRGPGVKHFGLGWLDYDLRDPGSTNPTLTVSTAVGPLAPTFAAIAEPTAFAELSDLDRHRFMVSRRDQGVTVRITQTGASSKTEIYALELEENPMSMTEGGRQ